MFAILVVIPVVFIALGFLLTEKNAPNLLSGYSSLTDEEKEEFPLHENVRFYRRFHFLMGGFALGVSLLLYGLGFEDYAVNWVIFFPLVAYLYYIAYSRRFAPRRQHGLLWTAFTMLALVVVGVLALMNYGDKTNRLAIEGDNLVIDGFYGITLPKQQIDSLAVTSELPPIRMKRDGFATGVIRKGHFRTVDGRTIRLLLNSQDAPMLYIRYKGNKEIYYQPDDSEIDLVYQALEQWRKD